MKLNDSNQKVALFHGKYPLDFSRIAMLHDAVRLLEKADDILEVYAAGLDRDEKADDWKQELKDFANRRKKHFESGEDYPYYIAS